jgi:hypothetical protein
VKKGKGKEKRCRDDDFPPKPSPEVLHQVQCMGELKKHLFCQVHSDGDIKKYCWVKEGSQTSEGGHRALTHPQMSLWAKHIVR